MRPKRFIGRGRAFTLVELLVVISILALLIAILLPSFKRAREGSKRVRCGTNLHAIGQGLTMYLMDSNDFLPVVEFLPSTPSDPDNPRPRVADVLLPFIRKNADVPSKKPTPTPTPNGQAKTERPTDEVFHCPGDVPGKDDRPDENTGKTYYETEGSSYAFNTRLYRMTNTDSLTNGEFANPVKLSEVVRSRRAQHMFGGQAAEEEIWLLRDYIAFHGKPGKPLASNYLYVDGRVADLQR